MNFQGYLCNRFGIGRYTLDPIAFQWTRLLSSGTRLWYNRVYRTLPVWCKSLGRLGPDLVEQLISLLFSFILGKSPKNHNITETFLMIFGTFTQSKTSKGSNSKSGQNRPKLDLHQTTSRYEFAHLKEFVRSDFS